MPYAGPVSFSLHAVTGAVAAWMAAYMTAVWIASDDAISNFIFMIVCLFS